jgi:hypothetical protein
MYLPTVDMVSLVLIVLAPSKYLKYPYKQFQLVLNSRNEELILLVTYCQRFKFDMLVEHVNYMETGNTHV